MYTLPWQSVHWHWLESRVELLRHFKWLFFVCLEYCFYWEESYFRSVWTVHLANEALKLQTIIPLVCLLWMKILPVYLQWIHAVTFSLALQQSLLWLKDFGSTQVKVTARIIIFLPNGRFIDSWQCMALTTSVYVIKLSVRPRTAALKKTCTFHLCIISIFSNL